MFRMECKEKVRSKEIESLKVKLLKAKIETVHEIREAIS